MRPRPRVRPLHPSPRRKLYLAAACLAVTAVSIFLQGSRPALAPGGGGLLSFPPVNLPILRDLFAPQPAQIESPTALLAEARHERLNGVYEHAATLYRQAWQQDSAPQTAVLAAEASLAAGDYGAALDMAAAALQRDPESADAYLIEAQAYIAMGQPAQAIQPLGWAERDASLGGYAAFKQAELLSDQGDEAGARAAYARAFDLPMARLWKATAGHRLGLSYVAAGDPASAVTWLRRAAQVADQVETADPPTWFDRELVAIRREARRPPIVLDLARAQRAASATSDAVATFADIVTTYPTASEGADALDALDAMGAGSRVSDYWRGRALYAANRPRQAVAAFQEFLDDEPSSNMRVAATYYMALANGDLRNFSDQRRGLEAVGYGNPDSSLAPEALARIARTVEAAGAVDEAIEAYAAVARTYPGSDQAVQSLLRAATLQVDRGDVAGAQGTWRWLADYPPTSRAKAQALFWLGRSLLQAGDRAAGMAALAEAADSSPRVYEGIRARDLAAGGLGAEPYARLRTPQLSSPSDGADDAACVQWIIGWAGPVDGSAGATVAARIQRLADLGLAGPAMAEALDAAADFANAPASLHRLSRELSHHGLFAVSIHAANRLAAASPARNTDDAPGCVRRLAYPIAFEDLVRAQAAQNGLDPYVLLALLRQESWFDPRAQSGSPAYGLGQITAPTAADIARGLGRSAPSADDLFRPRESIQFGAWYLAQQGRGMNDRTLLALAAYNAGPGSALRWAGNNRRIDPDDFVSAITFMETRTYVRSVYEIYNRYRELYGD
jgi:soluble lytic murein transglycosylase